VAEWSVDIGFDPDVAHKTRQKHSYARSALERQIWRPIGDSAHVIVATEPPWMAIPALLFVAVIVGAIVAAVPARRVRQLQPAKALHAE
jgi:hypothetical protein